MAASAAPNNPVTTLTTPSDVEIVMTRIFDARRQLVFEAYTDPKHIPHWWGPRRYTITVEQMDVRPGGAWRFVQRGSSGEVHAFRGVYREVVPVERIVATFEYEAQPGHEVLNTTTFEERDGKTKLTVTSRFLTMEDRDGMLNAGMESGATESWDRVAEYIENSMNASTTNPSTEATLSGDKEIIFTRTFDAPRELVFEAWTNPSHVPHWWGPHGFTTTILEMDVRPGGVWRLVMRGPDGTDYHNRIVFVDVVKPSRLVYKNEGEAGSEPVSFETTVTFTDKAGRTEVTMRMLFPSAGVRDHVVQKYGAVEGGKQTLGRLANYLPRVAWPELILTRVFDAPRDLVFDAWTDRDRLARWWGPKGFTNPVCEIEVRVGGAIRIHMRAPNGVVYPMTGVFREIDPPHRLVFTAAALDAAGDPMFEVRNAVTFEEEAGKTRLTLRATVLSTTAAAPQHLAGMETGWCLSLDRLASEVTR